MTIFYFLRCAGVVLILTACSLQNSEARTYQLWGGRALVNLPAGFKLQKAGPYAFLVVSTVRGKNPRVVTLTISRIIGSEGTYDWSGLVDLWNFSIDNDPRMRAVVRPWGRGNTFNVETLIGSGRFGSRSKLRAINGPRRYELDLRNLYTVNLMAVPASAWSSPEGRRLLSAFQSFRVKR
jgi:hypothetical protein